MVKKKNLKIDKRTIHKMKYLGSEERMVHLARRNFIVNKGDVFDVSVREASRFKNKTNFKQVK